MRGVGHPLGPAPGQRPQCLPTMRHLPHDIRDAVPPVRHLPHDIGDAMGPTRVSPPSHPGMVSREPTEGSRGTTEDFSPSGLRNPLPHRGRHMHWCDIVKSLKILITCPRDFLCDGPTRNSTHRFNRNKWYLMF